MGFPSTRWTILLKTLAVLALGLISSSLFGQQPACHVNPRILVLSNYGSEIVATDFASHMPGLTFSSSSVANATPTLDYLNQFDAVLVFEDGNFSNASSVGDVVSQYFSQGNKGVVLGVFYWQDAKDSPIYGSSNYGWGALEAYAPLVNGDGDESNPRTLNPATIVTHAITSGVNSLSVDGNAGGVKVGAGTALAYWNESNHDGTPDPVVGINEQSGSRIAALSVAPLQPVYGTFSGDFYQLWQNALTWAAFASDCGSPTNDQYTFTGFMRPVDNPPILNMAKAGSAVPVKFSLNGDQGLEIFAPEFPASQQIACGNGAELSGLEPTATTGRSMLTYDAGANQYTYVWKTSKDWTGTCRQLILKLKDGTDHRAKFSFAK
jgi:hypothetical protein